MPGKTQVEQLAAFAQDSAFEDLPDAALACFKLHVLDTLGCAVGALDSEPPRAVRRTLAGG
jgi:2-methylcitrate dehydratase